MQLSTLLLSLLALAGSAQAAVTFTLTGTITQDGGDAFDLGETFTLTFTSNPDIGEPNRANDATGVYWLESFSGGPVIWSDVSISGATGSYVAPAMADASSELRSNADRPLYLEVDTGSSTQSLGLIRGGEEFVFLEAWVIPSSTFTSYGATAAVRPENTFFNGTYALTTPFEAYFATNNYANDYYATFSSLTISGATAVPEPASSAALIGVAGLGFAFVRRRRLRGQG